jgi:hypothetical protein
MQDIMETRKEQIEKVSERWAESASDGLHYDKGPLKVCRKGGFVAGAKWADEHPREGLWDAEKVIEWLKEYTDDYIVCDSDDSWLRVVDFIRDLRKAMEE